MSSNKKLRITVDTATQENVMGANPFDLGGAVSRKVVTVSADKVRREISKALSTVDEVLKNASRSAKDFDLSEVSFTLGLEASGEVSLLSLASGSVGASSGLQFTFKRRTRATE
jgi:hypothetical protein